MPFIVPMNQAQKQYPEYEFISQLTPSEQKAAFHVRDEDGKDLCLKIIAPDYNLDRLHREIEALQSLSHPNIVRLVEYTFSSRPGLQRHFIVEEFIAGSDLHEHLKGIPWPLEKATNFFAQLFDGLNALYEKKIVHRDLKPHNIRVRPDNSPVIIDFGIARHLSLSDLTSTSEGAAFGSMPYFSPEQFLGTKHDIDHRTDLYAAGTIVYEALVGLHPFRQYFNSIENFKDKVCHSDEYKSNPGFLSLPQKWQLLISKLLEKEKAKRPLNAGQVSMIMRKIGG